MTPKARRQFDRLLEEVLAEAPAAVHELLRNVTLVIEDFPSSRLMRELEVADPEELCGLHTGVPLVDRSIEQSGILSDEVLLYRSGIVESARDEQGRIKASEVRRQIRITLLHELGHHVGLSEDDLRELGYD